MAAVNFPNNPSVNDTHTSSGSTWKWDGTVWQRLGVAGPQGAQGVQGAAGSGGAAGAQGAQGVQGAAGSGGAAGAQGAQGVQGAANATTINNNANNKVITGSGTANTLEAESDFTWDSSTSILSVGNQLVRIGSGNAGQNSGSRSTTVGNYCGQSSGGYSCNVGGNNVGNSAGGYSVNVGGNAVGSNAGQYSINIGGNATGYSNAAQYSINIGGQYTGYSNAGEHCINIGYSAGYQSGGKYGVNIGYNAGNWHSVNSSHNVAVGYEALKWEGSNKYCIGIGASCYLPIQGSAAGGAADNQLVIGVGHTAWIYGTKNYNIGLGVTNPTRNLHIDGTAHQSGIIIHTAGNHSTAIDMDSNRSSAAGGLAELNFKWNGTTVGQIGAYAGADTTNKDDGHIHFGTASAGSIVERLRITSTGELVQYGNVGSADGSADDLVLGDTTSGTNRGMTIYSHNAQNGSIAFADNDNNFKGAVQYMHNGDRFRILTGGQETFRVQSGGTDGVCTFFMGGTTNNNNKYGALTLNHYTFNTYNQIDLIKGTSTSGVNKIEIGGSGSSANTSAATSIQLYTAANATTNNGTERFRITSDGTIHVNSSDSASGGRLYATGSAMYVQSGNGRQTFKVSDAASGVNRTWEITTDGNLKAPDGKGIDFSATESSNTTESSVLADYEEGTFTPHLQGYYNSAWTNVTFSSVSRYGRYVKIGKLVHVIVYFVNFHIDSQFDNTLARLGSFPFTVGPSNNTAYSILTYAHGNAMVSTGHGFYTNPGYATASSVIAGGTNYNTWSGSSGRYLMVSGTYTVA